MIDMLARARRADFILLLLCCIIAMLALVLLWKANDSWVYSAIGDLDTWIYVGYGLYWGDPAYWASNYKASRLPWILYEFLHYHFLGPDAAVPVIQLSCYLWLVIGNYLFTRRLFNPLVSGLTSVALVLWTHIHANGGADYHNTLSGPLFVWCAYATLRLMQDRAAAPWFAIPGALYLALVVTNPIYVNLSPALIALALFLWWNGQKDVRYLLSCCAAVLFGIAAAFILLGLINVFDGRNFMFVSQIFALSKYLLIEGGNTWWKGWGWWTLETFASYLGPLAAMLLIAAVELTFLLRLRHWNCLHRRAALVHGIYIFHVLLWIAWQSIGQTALDYHYFAYPLWVPWFWSLAAVLAVRVGSSDIPTSLLGAGLAVVTMATFTVVALVFGSGIHGLALRQLHYLPLQAGLIVLAFYVVLVAATFARTAAVIVAFVLCYPMIDLLAEQHPNRHALTTCNYGADGFHSVIRASRFISSYVATPENARVWFDESESMINQTRCPRNIGYGLFGYLLAVSGFGFFGPAWPMRSIDAIPDDYIKQLSDPRYVVAVASSTPDTVEKMRKRFARLGVPVNLIDQRDFNSETIAYSVYLLRSTQAGN